MRFIKALLLVALHLGVISMASAQTQATSSIFASGTTTNWTINIPTNTAIKLHYACNGWSVKFKKDGIEIPLRDSSFNPAEVNTTILQGPAELVFSVVNSSVSSFVCQQLFPSTGLFTKVYKGEDFLNVEVPAGKTLRLLFASNPNSPSISFRLTDTNGSAADGFFATTIKELFFPGPVTFTLPVSSTSGQLLTYYLTDDLVALPDGVVQTSAQGAISVEKSSDLSSWSTAGILQAPDSPQTFYRLKVAQ